MKFRQDINGLRAIAVLSVVLYHFGVPGFSGGFVGVDVFFVISGYLMTKIIMTKIEKDSFSLVSFYIDRGRRIIPALAFLCFVLLIFGWFYLISYDYRQLGMHVASSLGFLSNIIYWIQAGYFDTASHEKWLLHTWSLSVEWQFYILYPILIIALHKFIAVKSMKTILVLLTIGSLIFSIIISSTDSSAAFYLLPTRAWEMLIGGLVFLYPFTSSNKQKVYIERLGLLLIAFSIIYFSPTFKWPGYFALIPTLGTALVIIAARTNSAITSNAVCEWFGKTSYSIYLWHWPIVVLFSYESLLDNSYWIIIGIVSSFLLGFISYKSIENKFIKTTYFPIEIRSLIKLSALTIVIGFSGSLIYKFNGMNSELRAKSYSAESLLIDRYKDIHNHLEESYNLKCDFYSKESKSSRSDIPLSCTEKENNEKSIFLWGDSHAQAFYWGLTKNYSSEYKIQQVATSGCHPSLKSDDNSKLDNNCNKSNQYAVDEIKRTKPHVVVLAQATEHEKVNWELIANTLRNIGVNKVVLLGPVPQWQPSLPNLIARKYYTDYKNYLDSDKSILLPINSVNQKVLNTNDILLDKYRESKSITFVSLINLLCQKSTCLASIPKKKSLLVVDYGHLSNDASVYITKKIAEKIL